MADWTWQPAIGDDIAMKGTRLAVTLSVAAVGCVVAGILLGNARALVVIALMLATIVWLGRSNTKQLESLRVSVDGGIATFADSRRTTTVDLRTVERVAVSSRGDYQAHRCRAW